MVFTDTIITAILATFLNIKFYPTLSSHTRYEGACLVFALHVEEFKLQNFLTGG